MPECASCLCPVKQCKFATQMERRGGGGASGGLWCIRRRLRGQRNPVSPVSGRSLHVANVSEHRGRLCEEGGFCRPFGAWDGDAVFLGFAPQATFCRPVGAWVGDAVLLGFAPQATFCRPVGAWVGVVRIPGAYARRLLTVAPLGLKGGGVGGGGGPSWRGRREAEGPRKAWRALRDLARRSWPERRVSA